MNIRIITPVFWGYLSLMENLFLNWGIFYYGIFKRGAFVINRGISYLIVYLR